MAYSNSCKREDIACIFVDEEGTTSYYLTVVSFNNKFYFGLVKKHYDDYTGKTTTKFIHIPHDNWALFLDHMLLIRLQFPLGKPCMFILM